MFTKECKRCGVEFDAIYPHTLYCSNECKRAVENEYMRKYRSRNLEKLRKYNREYQRGLKNGNTRNKK
jgi:predicted nucleic acid-binding Zn ribbon protein